MSLSLHICMLFVDEWTMEDKVIFEQAYQKYGKNFQRIKSMVSRLPRTQYAPTVHAYGTYVHTPRFHVDILYVCLYPWRFVLMCTCMSADGLHHYQRNLPRLRQHIGWYGGQSLFQYLTHTTIQYTECDFKTVSLKQTQSNTPCHWCWLVELKFKIAITHLQSMNIAPVGL